ncbi:MAG: PilZ domain-containing protein [Bdellovibrionales bacterium]
MERQQSHLSQQVNLIKATHWAIETEDHRILSEGEIISINRSGVCVTLNEQLSLKKGQSLQFTLYFEGKKLFSVDGAVHWIRHSTITNNLYIGLKFLSPITEFDMRIAELQVSENQNGAA